MKKLLIIMTVTLILCGCSGNINKLHQAIDNFQELTSGEIIYTVNSNLPFFMLSEQKYEITFTVEDNIVKQKLIQDENIHVYSEYNRSDNSVIKQTRFFSGNESNVEDISDREPFLLFSLFSYDVITNDDYKFRKEDGFDVYMFDNVTYYIADGIVQKQIITELYEDGFETVKTAQLLSYK